MKYPEELAQMRNERLEGKRPACPGARALSCDARTCSEVSPGLLAPHLLLFLSDQVPASGKEQGCKYVSLRGSVRAQPDGPLSKEGIVGQAEVNPKSGEDTLPCPAFLSFCIVQFTGHDFLELLETPGPGPGFCLTCYAHLCTSLICL